MIELSVQIMTFHREAGLRRAVASVLSQRDIDPATIEIVVVDNSAEGAAHEVATELAMVAADGGFTLRYVHEPQPGIAAARNAGIRAAAADFIAYIDDDEEAAPDWLVRMRACLDRFDADAVGGPVLPIFEDARAATDPFWAWIYDYDQRLPSGSPFRATGTGNCLFRKSRCCETDRPFDPALGLTGGSDTRFFHGLMRRDRRVLWCAEGIVHEYVPSARTELRYGLGRRLRQSQLYIQTFFWGDRPDRCAIAKWMVVGVMQMLAYAPLSLIFWPIDRPRAKRFLALVYGGLGKVFWTPRFMAIAYGRRAAAVE